MYSTSDPDICRTSDGLPCVMWEVYTICIIDSVKVVAAQPSNSLLKRIGSGINLLRVKIIIGVIYTMKPVWISRQKMTTFL
ncbi:hypothetical protein OUZ56_032710 [Daphnia magna]|uniref:Uncharacterized protein n=1 Tax=Daphnia magna TaxID=35525 RepID=A0ABQ9ZWW4_9CRUS|nr:hypothetical protein OUZ56_032710 [Daphnia magna]